MQLSDQEGCLLNPDVLTTHSLLHLSLMPCAEIRPGQVPYEPHMLDAAASPLMSALPQYERSFQDHLSTGQAYLGATHVSPLPLSALC